MLKQSGLNLYELFTPDFGFACFFKRSWQTLSWFAGTKQKFVLSENLALQCSNPRTFHEVNPSQMIFLMKVVLPGIDRRDCAQTRECSNLPSHDLFSDLCSLNMGYVSLCTPNIIMYPKYLYWFIIISSPISKWPHIGGKYHNVFTTIMFSQKPTYFGCQHIPRYSQDMSQKTISQLNPSASWLVEHINWWFRYC